MMSNASNAHPHLPNWPPDLPPAQLHELTTLATTYALAHGLLYLPPSPAPAAATAIPSSAIHAPITLLPSPFPRRLFEHARRLQRVYNVLYARIALDTEFLDSVMGAEAGVGRVDAFTGQLWRGWRALRAEGLVQVRSKITYSFFLCFFVCGRCESELLNGARQPLHLGIFRSDYLLHSPSPDEEISLKQVEFNTISSSFGALSERVAGLHRCALFFPLQISSKLCSFHY